MSLPIGEVSRRSGLSADALRFYEREGIIPPPERTGGGARRYDPSVLDHLQVVTALRRIGFGLDEVRDLLAAKSEHRTVRGRVAAARESIERLEARLDEKEQALADARQQLQSWRAELDSGEPWPDVPVHGGEARDGGEDREAGR
ncbi:MerR family transcriptional regulator [Brachybacterium sp. DNPG3]